MNNKILKPTAFSENCIYYPHWVDIETVRHCNSSCLYCPQSIAPKKESIMPWHVFEKIMARLDGYNTTWVAMNHYGEPLMDPLFEKRVATISPNHKVFLATNGVFLTEKKIDFLADKNIHSVSFNFPSINSQQWSILAGLPLNLFSSVKRSIELSIRKLSHIATINIIVQSIKPNQSQRIKEIEGYFSYFGDVNIIKGFCRSRAGAIENQYVMSTDHKSEIIFLGCDRITSHLHVSWDGKCYLCCEDYYQKFILGDLMDNDIMSVMRSRIATRLREEIHGIIPMREDLICRRCPKIRHEVITSKMEASGSY